MKALKAIYFDTDMILVNCKADISAIIKYIEAYDPEGEHQDFDAEKDCEEKESVWNQIGDGLGLVFVNKDGELSISDEFAKAIKAKIMPKVDVDVEEDKEANFISELMKIITGKLTGDTTNSRLKMQLTDLLINNSGETKES